MTSPHYTDGPVTIWHGDCIDVMRGMPDNSVDAVVTDPPYGLGFMGREWDAFGGPAGITDPAIRAAQQAKWGTKFGASARPAAPAAGEMHAFQAWCEEWATEAYRLLKPGGHLLAFGGTRTFHRLASGIEDAGFEIRDSIAWLYGSGFPKSLDVSKAIDKAAGAEREVVGSKLGQPGYHLSGKGEAGPAYSAALQQVTAEQRLAAAEVTAPATADAARWNGWGTALKPAFEPIVVARKPLTGTVAANVLAYGTGALNIDGSRIGTTDDRSRPLQKGIFRFHGFSTLAELEATAAVGGKCPDGRDAAATLARYRESSGNESHEGGRWPANVVLDVSQAAALDQQSGTSSSKRAERGAGKTATGIFGAYGTPDDTTRGHDEEGGASRFFKTVDTVTPRFMYTAKAGSDERPKVAREGGGNWTQNYGGYKVKACDTCDSRFPATVNEPPCGHGAWSWQEPRDRQADMVSHPTVKPVDLMRWLVKLVTPPGGTVLEPFAGSGTTVEAAVLEGFRCVAIEREGDYLPLILQRVRKPHAVGLDLDWDDPTPVPTPIRPAQARTGPRNAAPAPHPGFDFGDDWELDA